MFYAILTSGDVGEWIIVVSVALFMVIIVGSIASDQVRKRAAAQRKREAVFQREEAMEAARRSEERQERGLKVQQEALEADYKNTRELIRLTQETVRLLRQLVRLNGGDPGEGGETGIALPKGVKPSDGPAPSTH